MSRVLEGILYNPTHEWVKVEGDVAAIGITEFAAHQLGTVVFVDLPAVGTRLAQNREFGAVESVKAASDLFSPLSGTVVETNEDLVGDPEGVNRDAFGSWMIRIKIADPSELKNLLSPDQYRAVSK